MEQILEEQFISLKKGKDAGNAILHFTFKGKFNEDASVAATAKWRQVCDENPDQAYVHIWECSQMTGFDQKAKSLWMEHMKKYAKQMDKIILISENILIRGAARLMSKVTQHRLEVRKNLDDPI